ncbi:MAG TPA: hypothetical protein VK196_05705, partial [Magnetospirillum sp.]|nr:hypothetical protein [Magnetospirillum sp.]
MPRWLRRLIVGVAAALATAVAAMALFFVFLHTGPGERWTSGKLEETVAGLELDGYHLGWPFRMRADYMRLADAQGTWLQATAPELVWHPLRLWRRVLDIDRLVAARVEVLRLPQPPETEQGGGMPRLSGTLRLEELRLPVVLAAPVLGEQVNLELSGTAIMATGGGNVDISLRIQGGGFARVNGTAGTDYLDLRWYLQVPDLSRWQRLAGRPLAGSVTGAGVVVGRLPSPEISGSLDLTRGHADSLGWDHLGLSGQAIPEPRLLRLALRVDAEAPRWQGKALPQSSISAWAIGDLSPELGRIRLGHAQLVTPMATVEGSAVLDQWGRRSFLRLRAQATPPGMADRVTARGEFSGDLTVPRLAGRLDVTADRFASGIPVVDRGLGPRPRARIGLSVDGERIRLAPSR